MANSVEDYLIEGLSFKLSPGASYVTDRRSVSYFVAGSNVYQSGSGARVIRVNLTGDGWLDPSTVRLVYTLVNNDGTSTKILRPLSGPWSFIRRARCLVGGAIIDDVDYYNRVHEMLHILTSNYNRDNDDIEGFGQRWDSEDAYGSWDTTKLGGIPGGSSRTVSFKPLFGILNQPKYIPLSWCPIMMEFEVVNGTTDAIVSVGGSTFTSTNTSTSWQIQDVRVVCDLVTLDSALQNSYAEHVLSGKNLPINYSTYVSQFQTITSSDFAINVSRAVTRLKSVFINFDDAHGATSTSDVVHKTFNSFKHPMSGAALCGRRLRLHQGVPVAAPDRLEAVPRVSRKVLGRILLPAEEGSGHPRVGVPQSLDHREAIPHRPLYLLVSDTEKILEAGFTGLNTRSGDLMVVRGKYANTNDCHKLVLFNLHDPAHGPDSGDPRHWLSSVLIKLLHF
ncbi:MAG UNVERIFIED_CONTAM: hypothetical protein LVR18_51355 [Planctomycetaceae bacterium]